MPCWMQGILKQWEYNCKEPRKKRQQPVIKSNLLYSRLKNFLFGPLPLTQVGSECSRFSLSLAIAISFLLFRINSCCCNCCLLRGLVAMALPDKAVSSSLHCFMTLSTSALTVFPLFPKFWENQIGPTHFFFFFHRRPWQKSSVPLQSNQLT